MSKAKSVETLYMDEVIPTNVVTLVNGSFASNAYTIKVGEYNIYIDSSLDADLTVYLPPFDETVGSMYSIYITAVDAGNKVTIAQNAQDSPEVFPYAATADLNAAEEYMLLLNTGSEWTKVNTHEA